MDGLSPQPELVEAARAATELELLVMVRPESGPFRVDAESCRRMCTEISRARDRGADGVVLGCLDADGELDLRNLHLLREAADGLEVTFHRAFDEVADRRAAVDALIDAGVQRILTSGAATTAMAGRDELAELVLTAAGRIEIVVAGGVREDNIRTLLDATGAAAFHSALDRHPTAERVGRLVRCLQGGSTG
jgi:copper homeostasis protein